jgi:hypothetical protein
MKLSLPHTTALLRRRVESGEKRKIDSAHLTRPKGRLDFIVKLRYFKAPLGAEDLSLAGKRLMT